MSPFVPKDWKDSPDASTPITAASLEDMETRLAAYADSAGGTVSKASGSVSGKLIPAVCLHVDDPTNPIKAALARGYTFIWVSELYAALNGTGILPDKAALLCYDDGHSLTYSLSHPVIVSYGVKANLFICSDFLYGLTVDSSLSSFAGGTPMTWANARTMRDTGLWEFHNHTQTHKGLTTYSGAPRIAELNNCNAAILSELGTAPKAIAYPNGAYDPGVIDAVRTVGLKLGFDFATGVSLTQEFSMPDEGRYSINRATSTTRTWIERVYPDVFHAWEWDGSPGGRNASNALGYWSGLGTNVVQDENGSAIRLDSRVVGTTLSCISADYFRVRKSERVFYRFSAWSESQTAGNAGIRLAQYDSAKAFISNIDLASYSASTVDYVHVEGETALAATCAYIRIEVWSDAAYDGLIHYKSGSIRRAVS